MKNKVIMNNAWKIARNAVKKFGGKATDYFAEALKWAWKQYKEILASKGGRIAGVAPWFLRKEFNNASVVTQINQSVFAIKEETAKAFYIEATANEGGVVITNKFWAPKSVCI